MKHLICAKFLELGLSIEIQFNLLLDDDLIGNRASQTRGRHA